MSSRASAGILAETDHYAILEVPHSATQDDIKAAYRRMAKKVHPDKNPDDPEANEKFKKVNVAFNILGNAGKRAMYDIQMFGVRIVKTFQTTEDHGQSGGNENEGRGGDESGDGGDREDSDDITTCQWVLFALCCLPTGCYCCCCCCFCCCTWFCESIEDDANSEDDEAPANVHVNPIIVEYDDDDDDDDTSQPATSDPEPPVVVNQP